MKKNRNYLLTPFPSPYWQAFSRLEKKIMASTTIIIITITITMIPIQFRRKVAIKGVQRVKIRSNEKNHAAKKRKRMRPHEKNHAANQKKRKRPRPPNLLALLLLLLLLPHKVAFRFLCRRTCKIQIGVSSNAMRKSACTPPSPQLK